MSHLILRPLTLLLCVTLLAPVGSVECRPRSSQSRQKQSFKRLVAQAVKAYKAERFEEAIVAFKKALKINPQHRLHWNLAVLYERTGRLEQALYHVDEFLKDPKLKAGNRVKAEARRQQIVQQLSLAQAKTQPKPKPQPAPRPEPRPEPLDVSATSTPSFAEGRGGEATDDVVEVETVRLSGSRGLPEWGYWAAGGGLALLTGLGLHLYADQVWSQRPNTLRGAEEAQSEATTLSWVGDIFLVGGLVSGTISVLKWRSRGSARPTAQERRGADERALGLAEGRLDFTGQGLIWSGRF